MKTTLHTVLCVAIRLGAVLMAVGIVEQIPYIFLYSAPGDRYSAGDLWLSGAGLLLAFMLWLWPNMLARWTVLAVRMNLWKARSVPIKCNASHFPWSASGCLLEV